jgi:uncharacterized protein YukE
METERVREIASQLDQKVLDFLSKESTLRSASGQLSGAWRGGRSERFLSNLRALLGNYETQVQHLQDLALRVSREVNEWEEVAGKFGSGSTGSNPVFPTTPGGSSQSQPVNNDPFKSIIDVITTPEMKLGKDGANVLIGVLRIDNPVIGGILKWAGPAISVVSGLTFFKDLVNEDMQKYSTDAEREAAVIVDLLFAAAIQGIKLATTAAGLEMVVDGLKCALLGFFVGPALVTAALGVVVWGGGWAVSELLKATISNDSIRDSIIQFVAKGLSQQAPALQSAPVA